MAYIDRTLVQKCLDDLSSDNLIGNENDTFISLAEAKDRIEELPTADVVPRAVYDENETQRAYTINMLGECLEKAKAEVPREIFAEIENHLQEKKKAISMFKDGEDDFYDGEIHALDVFEHFLTELKKKYTKGELENDR